MAVRIEARDGAMLLAHYYRAMVGRADIWRTRMDATAHWAIGATAAVVSFALGDRSVPHYVVFIAALLTVSFLLLEGRRLTFYHLWQQRVLLLETGLIRPALLGPDVSPSAQAADPGLAGLLDALQPHLGQTIPSMPLAKAVARRLRRIYLYLFAVQVIAWVLKLSNHPTAATSIGQWLERAGVGFMPGAATLAMVTLLFVGALMLAILRGGVDRGSDS